MKARQLATSAVAFACASSLFLQPVLAQTNPGAAGPASNAAAKPSAGAKTTPNSQDIMKFSQAGNTAIREVGNARLAIFNGTPDVAKELLAKAKADVEKAKAEAPTFAPKTPTTTAANTAAGTPQTQNRKWCQSMASS